VATKGRGGGRGGRGGLSREKRKRNDENNINNLCICRGRGPQTRKESLNQAGRVGRVKKRATLFGRWDRRMVGWGSSERLETSKNAHVDNETRGAYICRTFQRRGSLVAGGENRDQNLWEESNHVGRASVGGRTERAKGERRLSSISLPA